MTVPIGEVIVSVTEYKKGIYEIFVQMRGRVE